MESPFIAQETSRRVSKKTLLVAALAFVAVVGVLCVYNADAIEYRIFNGVGNSVLVYKHWKQQHGKFYGLVEDVHRYATFKQNYYFIEEHNKQGKSFTLALNKFADLSNREYAALYTGANPDMAANVCEAPNSTVVRAADTLDWRDKGYVNPVKDQQQCGSCWAFSTTGSLEGLSAAQGKLGSFSEQQLVDCSTSFGNYGCNGGWVQNAFHYVIQNGIAGEDVYTRYSATDGTCMDTKFPSAMKISGCMNVKAQSVEALKQALQVGPVSVYIEADTSVFQFYSSGVISDPSCFVEGHIDHAVLAVGYDETSFIIKNSWGVGWGNAGYVNLGFSDGSDNGSCGLLANLNSYPLA